MLGQGEHNVPARAGDAGQAERRDGCGRGVDVRREEEGAGGSVFAHRGRKEQGTVGTAYKIFYFEKEILTWLKGCL